MCAVCGVVHVAYLPVGSREQEAESWTAAAPNARGDSNDDGDDAGDGDEIDCADGRSDKCGNRFFCAGAGIVGAGVDAVGPGDFAAEPLLSLSGDVRGEAKAEAGAEACAAFDAVEADDIDAAW
jgi:hypothetical protein